MKFELETLVCCELQERVRSWQVWGGDRLSLMESEDWTVTLKESNLLMMYSSLLGATSKHHRYPCRDHQELQPSLLCLPP